ncbi:MAG: DUF6273 domain-containing protein [bacterium]
MNENKSLLSFGIGAFASLLVVGVVSFFVVGSVLGFDNVLEGREYMFTDKDHSGETYTYLYYGNFPQTVETNEKIVAALDAVTTTNSSGYYEYKRYQYAKVTTDFYSSTPTWSDGEEATNNTSYYFKVEPIKWRVIQNGDEVKVISEYILDNAQFNTTTLSNTTNGTTIYANNYTESAVRQVLRDSFLNSAFNSTHLTEIRTDLVDNSKETTDNIEENKYTSNNVADKLTLLSYQDMLNTDFEFSDDVAGSVDRQAVVTDYALAMNCEANVDGIGNWWLRTPSSIESSSAYFVDLTGALTTTSVTTSGIGIRPSFNFVMPVIETDKDE